MISPGQSKTIGTLTPYLDFKTVKKQKYLADFLQLRDFL